MSVMSDDERSKNPPYGYVYETAEVGELVVAAYDAAAQIGNDARDISRLATTAVRQILKRARKAAPAPRRPPHPDGGN
jgi:hypothetical protein